MDLNYTEEERAFQSEVRQFLADNLPKNIAAAVRAHDCLTKEMMDEWHAILNKKGWLATVWPKDFGGPGWSPVQKHIFEEECCRANAPRIVPFGVNMLGPVLQKFGTKEQQDTILPRILSGEDWWCQGYSEPGAGSDLASLKTRAVREGDDYVINGQKTWTTLGQHANKIFCLVRTSSEGKPQEGISFLLVDLDTPGIEMRPIRLIEGGHEVNEVFFTDVRIPAANIVGKRGEGWKVANATLTHERGSLADPDVMMNRLYALIDLMKSETIDGERVIDKPAFRDRLLRVQGKVLAQQANALRLLSSSINKGQDTTMARFITKLIGTELRHELEGLAIDAMGEIGTLYEDSPHLRDSGSWQMSYMYFLGLIIGGGTNQIQKNIISERALGMPKEPKIPGA